MAAAARRRRRRGGGGGADAAGGGGPGPGAAGRRHAPPRGRGRRRGGPVGRQALGQVGPARRGAGRRHKGRVFFPVFVVAAPVSAGARRGLAAGRRERRCSGSPWGRPVPGPSPPSRPPTAPHRLEERAREHSPPPPWPSPPPPPPIFNGLRAAAPAVCGGRARVRAPPARPVSILLSAACRASVSGGRAALARARRPPTAGAPALRPVRTRSSHGRAKEGAADGKRVGRGALGGHGGGRRPGRRRNDARLPLLGLRPGLGLKVQAV